MIVCLHGDAIDFCKNHDMVIGGMYVGEIEDYDGAIKVLVTDQEMSRHEYFFLKGKLFARGVELVSTRYKDDDLVSEFLMYSAGREQKNRHGGRYRFGYHNKNGEIKLHESGRAVVKRIFELRDRGFTYRAISEDAGVHHLDGGKLSISTIQIILQNREKYEEEGL